MSGDVRRGCPACPGVLFAAPDRAGVEGCSACGGIWADNETSRLVAAVLDPSLVDLADRAATSAALRRGAPLPKDGMRSCPECQAALVRVNTASTNLDVCALHGTWFDRGELQRVSRVLDGDRDRQIPRAASAGKWVVGNTSLNAGSQRESDVDATAVATDIAANLAIEAGFMAFRVLLGGASRSRDDD